MYRITRCVHLQALENMARYAELKVPSMERILTDKYMSIIHPHEALAYASIAMLCGYKRREYLNERYVESLIYVWRTGMMLAQEFDFDYIPNRLLRKPTLSSHYKVIGQVMIKQVKVMHMSIPLDIVLQIAEYLTIEEVSELEIVIPENRTKLVKYYIDRYKEAVGNGNFQGANVAGYNAPFSGGYSGRSETEFEPVEWEGVPCNFTNFHGITSDTTYRIEGVILAAIARIFRYLTESEKYSVLMDSIYGKNWLE